MTKASVASKPKRATKFQGRLSAILVEHDDDERPFWRGRASGYIWGSGGRSHRLYVSEPRVSAIAKFDWAGRIGQIDPLATLLRWVDLGDDYPTVERAVELCEILHKPTYPEDEQEAEWVMGFAAGAIDSQLEWMADFIALRRRLLRPLNKASRRVARSPGRKAA